jgi:hypothetical protein
MISDRRHATKLTHTPHEPPPPYTEFASGYSFDNGLEDLPPYTVNLPYQHASVYFEDGTAFDDGADFDYETNPEDEADLDLDLETLLGRCTASYMESTLSLGAIFNYTTPYMVVALNGPSPFGEYEHHVVRQLQGANPRGILEFWDVLLEEGNLPPYELEEPETEDYEAEAEESLSTLDRAIRAVADILRAAVEEYWGS